MVVDRAWNDMSLRTVNVVCTGRNRQGQVWASYTPSAPLKTQSSSPKRSPASPPMLSTEPFAEVQFKIFQSLLIYYEMLDTVLELF